MTKKDYIKIADAINDTPGLSEAVKSGLALRLVIAFEDDNPRFDAVTFFEAVGL